MNDFLPDIVLLAIILIGVYAGWHKGTINVLGGIGAIVLGYILARNFSAGVAEAITEYIPALQPAEDPADVKNLLSIFLDMDAIANRIVQILAFVVIFVVVHFAVKKLAKLLSGVFHGTLLGTINNAVGAFLCLIITVLLVVIAVDMVLPVFAKTSWGEAALTFVAGSRWMLNFIYACSGMLIANLPQIAEIYKK